MSEEVKTDFDPKADELDSVDKEAVEGEEHELELSNEMMLNAQLEEAKSSLIRATADFENMKKRLEKEKITAVNFANEDFARDLLAVIDALESALAQETEGDEIAQKFKDGIGITVDMVLKVFDKYKIKPISTDGEFDPNLHNAINYIESDSVESGNIAQVYQKGYTINDRVLRPSMVVIAK